MMTKPPPYDRAPTLKATHATDNRPPAATAGAATNGSSIPGWRRGDTRGGARSSISTRPQLIRTSTRNGPISAAATPPIRRKAAHLARAGRAAPILRQLAGARPMAALSATAGTAASAPAAAPLIQTGGWAARKTADNARMTISPGTMKHAPPTSAPRGPRSRHAQKIASWVEAGPGSMLVAATPSSNSRAEIQSRRSTHSTLSSAMCAGGPPNPMQPMRPHSRAIVSRETCGGAADPPPPAPRSAAPESDPPDPPDSAAGCGGAAAGCGGAAADPPAPAPRSAAPATDSPESAGGRPDGGSGRADPARPGSG